MLFKTGIRRSELFQSLSGFQVRCNGGLNASFWRTQEGFNPYRVFKFVATLWWTSYHPQWQRVSIPIGFSSSLQLETQNGIGWRRRVSIPIGFSSSLQPKANMRMNFFIKMFQSLSGFQVRCNGTMTGRRGAAITCFNPYRVFKFVATCQVAQQRRCAIDVSIPIGFSSSLQRRGSEPDRRYSKHVSIPIGFSSSLQLW